ncbi:MAG: septum formation initiator family protein [Acutalibacteraceae bacterium]
MAAKKKTKKTKSFSIIVVAVCVVLVLFLGVRFIKAQNEINEKQAQLTELQSQYDEVVAQNEDVKNAISENDENALAEEYARKKGYVMPDERVYVDVTPGK